MRPVILPPKQFIQGGLIVFAFDFVVAVVVDGPSFEVANKQQNDLSCQLKDDGVLLPTEKFV
jgi:hypothetical protein